MRKLIASLLFIFWPGLLLSPAQRSVFFSQNVRPAAGGSPITFVREVVAARSNGTVVTSSFTCASGDYLYIYAGTYSATDTFTVTTTTGNTVASVVSNKPASDTSAQVFSVSSCNGTAGTYTLTDGSGSYLDFALLEFSGVHGVDATNTCVGGGYSATCSVTTVTAATYVIGSMETNSLGPINLATGWTNYQSTLNGESALQGIAKSGAGSVSWAPSNGTNGGGTTDTEIIVALK